jgi:hypothetical protein
MGFLGADDTDGAGAFTTTGERRCGGGAGGIAARSGVRALPDTGPKAVLKVGAGLAASALN